MAVAVVGLCLAVNGRSDTQYAEAIALTTAAAETDARQFAHSLSQSTEHVLAQVRALQGLVRLANDAQRVGNADLELTARTELNRWRGQMGGGVLQVASVDPDGSIAWSNINLGPTQVSVADRDYFLAIARDGARDFVSSPVIGRISGRPNIQFAHGNYRMDGTLQNLSLVGVDPKLLTGLGADIGLPRDTILTLLRPDGGIVVRGDARGDSDPGTDETATLQSLLSAPNGVQHIVDRNGQRDRVLGWSTVVPDTLAVMVEVDLKQRLEALSDELNRIDRTKWLLTGATGVAGACLTVLVWSRMQRRAKKAHIAALRESETQFRNMAEGMPDVVTLVDRDARIVYVNPAILSVFGIPPKAAIGHSIGEFITPADRPNMEILNVLRQPVGYRSRRETQLWLPDGRTFWVENHLRKIAPTDGKPSDPVAVIVTRDLSGRRAMELAMRQSNEDLDFLLTSTLSAVFRLDLTDDAGGILTFVSDSFQSVTGFSSEEICQPGRFAERLDRASAATWNVHRPRLLREGSKTVTCRFQHKAGHWIWLLIALRRADGDSEMRFVGHLRDVTREHTRDMQLAQVGKLAMVGKAMAGMAAELNQPLTGISTIAEHTLLSMETHPANAAGIKDELERIVGQAGRAASIIDQLQLFGRRPTDVPVVFDVADAIDGALAILDNRLGRASIVVLRDIAPNAARVVGHLVLLEQVLADILSHAADAMDAQLPPLPPHRRHIDLHLRQHGDTVVLRVADHAGGIDPAILPRIFEPFLPTTPAVTGTGLGLSICSGIVKDMGGSLTAANQGDGTVFEIRLPGAGPADGQPLGRDKGSRLNSLPA